MITSIKTVNSARKSAKAAANVAKAASPGCRLASGVISGAAGFAIGAGAGAAVGVAYHLQETGSFEGALNAAINGGIMGGAMGLYSGLRNPYLCFTAGTQVMLRQDEDGNYVSIDIEDIQVGDYVLARDEDDPTGAIGLHRVAQKFVRTSYFITHLAIRDVETGNVENLETTDEHPFWTTTRGWVPAKELALGDLVLNPDGTYATVESNRETFHPEGVTVYNFEVEGAHTYFVADGLGFESFVWVHNSNCGKTPDNPREIFIDEAKYPESTKHLEDAGELDVVLKVNRKGTADRRRAAVRALDTKENYDRDEAPPAFLRADSDPVSVRHVYFSDNRGSGSSLGGQARGADYIIIRKKKS